MDDVTSPDLVVAAPPRAIDAGDAGQSRRRTAIAIFAASDPAFVLATFVGGRALVLLGFFIATIAPVPPHGISPVASWEIFTHWDGGWFREIALHGYEYAPDGVEHDVAFFPLFPIVANLLMRAGLTFPPVGTLLANACFLGTMLVAFPWLRARHGAVVARFAIATLALAPISIFGSLTYSEPLFLLLTALALRDRDRGEVLRAAVWAALASATRLAGLGLTCAFLLDAVRARRDPRAWLAVAIAPLGALAFAAYQGVRFGDPLAFIHTEVAWHEPGVIYQTWPHFFASRLVSHHHWLYILGFALAAAIYSRVRARAGPFGELAAAVVTVLLWGRMFGVEDDMKLLFCFVGAYALVRYRAHFTAFEGAYVLAVFVLIVAVRDPQSVDRYAWGLLPTSIALGYLWRRYPRLGFVTLGLGTIELVVWSLRFAQWIFVA